MAENGALFSNGIQLVYQLLGILVVIVWPMFWTSFLLKFIHSTVSFSLIEVSVERRIMKQPLQAVMSF